VSLLSLIELHTMNSTTTVQDIVRKLPSASAVFLRNGIDYCCGGKLTLGEACESASADPHTVLRALEALSFSEGTAALHMDLWKTDFLLEYIVHNHHDYVRSASPVIREKLKKVRTKHGERFPDICAISELFDDIIQTLQGHLQDEEENLFPQMRAWSHSIDTGLHSEHTNIHLLRSEVRKHEMEHVDVGKKLERMRAITNNFTPPAGACQTHQAAYHLLHEFCDDLMQHVFIENAVLFSKLDQQPLTIL